MYSIRPTARILILIFRRLAETSSGDVASLTITCQCSASSSDGEDSSSNSSSEHTDRTASSILITVDHINESALWSNGSPAFSSNERKTPGKRVLDIRAPVWVWAYMIRTDCNTLVRVLEHSTPVAIHIIEAIGCRENRDHRRELLCRGLTIHRIAAMHSDNDNNLGNYTYPAY
jgi:hypothetical protein